MIELKRLGVKKLFFKFYWNTCQGFLVFWNFCRMFEEETGATAIFYRKLQLRGQYPALFYL
jgi:hypothetical protein